MPFTESEFRTYSLKSGDILLNEGQSLDLVGRCAIYQGEPAECCFQNTLIRFQPGSEVTSEFAHLAFQNLFYQGSFARTALQTTSIANLGVTRFASLSIPVPGIHVQNQIVDIVATLTKVLNGLEALIALKGRFRLNLASQLLLGIRRSDRYSGPNHKNPPANEFYPTDWSRRTIGDICHEVNERAASQDAVPVLSCTKSRGLVDSSEFFGRRVHSADTSRYKLVKRGEFAYATNHLEEGSIGLLTHRGEGLVSPMYTVFKTNQPLNAHFLIALFKTERYRELFSKYTNSSVNRRGGIRWAQFLTLPVHLPSRQEQDWITKTICSMNTELETLETYRRSLRQQKKTLIARLLAGRIVLQ